MIDPDMPKPWIAQWYRKVPGLANVNGNVPEVCVGEANAPPSAVTEWLPVHPVFHTHVTVVPAVTDFELGLYALFTTVTTSPPPGDGQPEVVGVVGGVVGGLVGGTVGAAVGGAVGGTVGAAV